MGDFDWSLPYSSRRQPIFARNAVATSQPLATQAGLAMLARGGNAIDAALATAITLTVVEPCSNGLGSDLFALVWTGTELVGLNASGRAPAGWTPARFKGRSAMPERGWDTVTIPGAVAGWRALSERFGKLPFADLFAPAIRYAHDGYAVSPVIAEKWALAASVMPKDLGWFDHFAPRGRPPGIGEIFASPAMAASLAKIAHSGGDAFYRGELAEAMVRHAQASGGAHALPDFDGHTVDWVTPLAYDYRGTTVHEIPPNGQGISALMALGILENFDLAAHAVDSAAVQHLEIEAMKLAFADAYRYVSDARTMTVTPEQLLDRGYLAARARLIDPGAGARLRSGRAAEGRYRLSLRRRCVRHDGVADPVELHGLRLGRRGAGHRHQPAESRRGLRAGARAIPTKWRAASGRTTRSFRASSRAAARRSRRSA